MRTTTSIRRTAAAGTLACALLGPATVADARISDERRLAGALQQQAYYASYGASRDQHPQALYYSSYGEPEPIAAPVAPVSPDDTPWLTIGLASAAGLATASLAAVQRRRLRVRREFGRVTAG